jgi:dihydrofolate reductase
MRRLIVSNVMSLDGFFESKDKKLDWFVVDEEFLAYAAEMLRSVDTIVLGRATYEHMAAYWPFAPRDEIADAMNSLSKIVFSRTLERADWNKSRLVKGDAAKEIAQLKQQPGKDMVVLGSAALASSLLTAGLVDEYRVILTPVLLGGGNPLFDGIHGRLRLELNRTKLLRTGAIVLYYHPLVEIDT